MKKSHPYPGIRVTTNGNQLVSYYTESRLAEAGVFYPITPSTEMGELFQQSFAQGKLNVFGQSKVAIEAEGEHAAQGGAIAYSVTGKRVVNFTSGQGLIYGLEQYYHAPGKLSTMIVQVAARALTKHALNVHCGHDDIYGALDTGWIVLFAKDAQQAADQSLILRRVTELSLNPGINAQDGFLTSHLERTFVMHEAELIREFLGAPDDMIDCPTPAQRELFGPTRRRVPRVIDLTNPVLLGPVQNQEHYMNGVVARRNNFSEAILPFLEESYEAFAALTGRSYGLISPYALEDAETVFLSMGSAAENIEAAVDHLRTTRGAKVGSIHLNVIRPFPEAALIAALEGMKNVIVLERTDESLAGAGPMQRDLRTAFSKALENNQGGAHAGLPAMEPAQIPRIFGGTYGLGSRDFRPEHILGAYELVSEGRARQDGVTAEKGASFFALGIDHPYAVCSEETPSLLPDDAIAVRLHSIGGWGMITTGKNLGEIIGDLGNFIAKRDGSVDQYGREKEVLHVSANPKYGSEKKGAPTSYFLVVAPERIRVNCDLRHVDVVLCCDPKAFSHTNPLDGLVEGGAFVWESDETSEMAWQRIPKRYRKEILDKGIRLFTLPGFRIAKEATTRKDLQLRMQGNSFLGAFFNVSPFLTHNAIEPDVFKATVRDQYEKKFGRFGEKVIESNMQVMAQGFELITEIPHGSLDAPDLSSMRGAGILPTVGSDGPRPLSAPPEQAERIPLTRRETFDREFRAGLGYHQPASTLASVGMIAAATGDTASKFGARREVPIFIAENCTQCMECIAACPDTALPNTAQDISTILSTAVRHYVSDPTARLKLMGELDGIEERARAAMLVSAKEKTGVPFKDIIRKEIATLEVIPSESRDELTAVIDTLPLAYSKTTAIFASKEKKEPGNGGIFSIFVSDLCKGCGECVTECGHHEALKMVPEDEALTAKNQTADGFFNLLGDTDQKFLGLYDNENPQDSRAAALRNHLMVRRNYEALVSGDGACAGCGEKSVLRAIATLTEAYLRPLYHAKADRLDQLADRLTESGLARLAAFDQSHPEAAQLFRSTVAARVTGRGGENDSDTEARIKADPISDNELIEAMVTVLRQDAFNHRDIQAIDGRLANGMSVMAMGGHTGCNTVYGSTPPNNPHPYPWMNSLFQDGVTVAWLFGESFIDDHAKRSIVPERLGRALMDSEALVSADEAFDLAHFSDALMTDSEIAELPKAWAVGGDGGMGDIGFQNTSKVVLQNRPNVNILMLDTQVYSNTGGQNSDSSVGPGGFDMNQLGEATQGKLTEKKSVAETFLGGHGSPFVAQISMANAPKLYRAILDGLAYRGTSFFQAFTTCQPEHGVGDDMSTIQAQRIRDSRGLPEFVFNPTFGETYGEAIDLKGNPSVKTDWWKANSKVMGKYDYTVAHWAATEARFRRHFNRITEEEASKMVPLESMMLRLLQDDVVNRRFLIEGHRAFVPDFGVTIAIENDKGGVDHVSLSRQMTLFCVERRKSWRLLQSHAGIENSDYKAQRALLAKVDAGEIPLAEFLDKGPALLDEA